MYISLTYSRLWYLLGSDSSEETVMSVHVLISILPLWRNAQGPMTEEVRWGNFPTYGQTLTEHANSLPIVGRHVLAVADRPVDALLFMDCVHLHDHGEPLTGGDEHAENKTIGKDIREWVAFAEMVSQKPTLLSNMFLRAFTLQYVRKSTSSQLPELGQRLVESLRETHAYEAGLFEFTERFDYMLSAYDGYERGVRNEKETMLAHTLGNQVPKLDALVVEFPELGVLWSDELRAWLLSLEAK